MATIQSLNIPLDPALQLWVLLPITLATLLMALLRRSLSQLYLQPPPTSFPKLLDASHLHRARILQNNYTRISMEQLEARRVSFLKQLVRPPSDSPMTAMMNPESLANQVIMVLFTVLPHMLIGTWARYYFAGVAVCRLPFSLPPRFRSMLQSGIEVAGLNLDVSYVSSLSWYILNLFGNAALLDIFDNSSKSRALLPDVTEQLSMNMAPDRVFKQLRGSLGALPLKDHRYIDEKTLLDIDPKQFGVF